LGNTAFKGRAMPLSEHEKRLLDEIEQTLLIDDPGLASSLRSARPAARTRTFVLLAIGGLVTGSVLLLVALLLHGVAETVLAVIAFPVIVAAADCGLRATSRVRALRRPDRPDPRPTGPRSDPA
jgi:hypothetical protein